jgi:hypothetical protein
LASQALRVVKSFAVVLPLCWLLLGKAGRHGYGMTKYPAALSVLAIMLTGYFLVYVATPHDLTWHLKSSADRLLLHLWPLGIWTVFLYLATPKECSSSDSARNKFSDSKCIPHTPCGLLRTWLQIRKESADDGAVSVPITLDDLNREAVKFHSPGQAQRRPGLVVGEEF